MITKRSLRPINYDEIANIYDQRYRSAYKPEGIVAKLLDLARDVRPERILEVGCGTGHWVNVLQTTAQVYGMDSSFGMLQKARERKRTFSLIHGDGNSLPFRSNTFDIIFCVNTLHHFDNPSGFIHASRQLLRRGGALAVIGMNPHTGRDQWFLYDYFPGAYEADLVRYPSPGTIVDWMIAADFESATWQVGERILDTRIGREVLPLPKNVTSQLTLLTPQAYRDGIARIEANLQEAEAAGETLMFHVDISLAMVKGRVQGKTKKMVSTPNNV